MLLRRCDQCGKTVDPTGFAALCDWLRIESLDYDNTPVSEFIRGDYCSEQCVIDFLQKRLATETAWQKMLRAERMVGKR